MHWGKRLFSDIISCCSSISLFPSTTISLSLVSAESPTKARVEIRTVVLVQEDYVIHMLCGVNSTSDMHLSWTTWCIAIVSGWNSYGLLVCYSNYYQQNLTWKIASVIFFFFSCTIHLDIKVFSPTDTQENCFKRSIKIYIKTPLTCFDVNTIIRELT